MDHKFCLICGTKLPLVARFCPNCGNAQEEEQKTVQESEVFDAPAEIPEEPPIAEELPAVEEAPVVEEMPVVEESPVVEDAPATKPCPACGADVAADNRFCGVCGAVMEAPATEEPAPVAEPETKKCPACGADVAADNRFCGVCGATLEEPAVEVPAPVAEPETKKCPACGADVAADNRFCGVCGAVMEAPATEEPAPVAEPETKKCPACGADVAADNRFCGVCGATMEAPAAEAVAPATKKCASCGADMPAGNHFCGVCGATDAPAAPAAAPTTKTCPTCGQVYPASQLFCGVCGTSLVNVAAGVPAANEAAHNANAAVEKGAAKRKNEHQPLTRSKRIMTIVLAALTFVLSIAMIVSAFLPVVTYDASNLLGMENAQVQLRPIDNLIFFADSLNQWDEDDLLDMQEDDDFPALYEDLEEVTKEYLKEVSGTEDYEDLDDSQKELANEYFVLRCRWYYSLEDGAKAIGLANTPTLFVLAALTALYFLAAVALMILSLVYLLIALFSKKGAHKIRSATLVLFFLMPALLLAIYIGMSFGHAINATLMTPTLALGATLSFIMAGVALLVHIVLGALLGKVRWRAVMIPRIMSTIFAIALLVTACMPLVNVTVEDYFDNSARSRDATVELGINDMEAFWLPESMVEYYDEMMELPWSAYEAELEGIDYSGYEISEFEEGEANQELVGDFLIMGSSFGFHSISWVFGLISVLVLITVVLAVITLWQNMVFFAGGKASSVALTLAKIFGLLTALVTVALVVLFALLMGGYVEEYLPTDLSMEITFGIGAIAAAVCALGCVCTPARVKSSKDEF